MKKKLWAMMLLVVLATAQGAGAVVCRDYYSGQPYYNKVNPVGASSIHAMTIGGSFLYFCSRAPSSNPMLYCFELGSEISDYPTFKTSLSMPTTTNRIVLAGDRAVLAMGSVGLGLVDLAVPDQLPGLSLTPTSDVCRDVALRDSTHVVTAEWSSLRIYEVESASSLNEVGAVTLTQARSVAIAGDLAFVACGSLGLAIVNIANPRVPYIVTQFPVGGFVDYVTAEGSRVYLTGYLLDLVIVDVTNPALPSVLHQLPLDGEAEAVAIGDGFAYVTVGGAITIAPPDGPKIDALALVKLNTPAGPAVVDYYFETENYSCQFLGSDRLLLGETESNAQLVQAPLQCPDPSDVPGPGSSPVALDDPWPNPFNPRVHIRFELPAGMSGQLSVHDLRGRRVAEVWRGVGSGREMTALWDGRDLAGRACSSGTYGFLLTDGTGQAAGQVSGTLLR